MSQELTKLAKTWSLDEGERRHDVKLGQRARGGDGGTPQAGEVVAVGAGDTFDQPEGTQAVQLARQARSAEFGQPRLEVGAAQAVDVERRALQGAQQSLFGAREEVQSLDGALALALRFGEAHQIALAAGGVGQRGEELEVAAIATEQNLAQVEQAVDGLFERSELPGGMPIPVFHLAMVLEKGNVIGGGFQAQHAAELVVHLHPGLAEAVLEAGAFDAGGEAAADLLGQLWGELLAQETSHLFGLDGEHGLARELLVQGLERSLGAKDQVGG